MPLIERCVKDEHLLRVRYEDLATRPEREVKRICAFLGMDYQPTMLDFCSVTHHVVNGNRMRAQKDSRIRLDCGWEAEMDTAVRKYFDRNAGAINRRLGYA